MIKLNELRIGNYLQDSKTSTFLTVTGIEKNNVSTYVIDRSKYPLPEGWELQPIPLTEEILLKCGFRKNIYSKNNFDMSIQINKYIFTIDIITKDFTLDYKPYDRIYLTNLHYLHQLQNWYFLYTGGKELEIKL